jgi:STE24 endopeptidase
VTRRWLIFIGAGAFCVSSFITSRAQEPTPSPAATESIAPNTAGMDPATATKAWLDSVPSDKRAKSDAYFEGGYWMTLWEFLLSVAIMFGFLKSGLSVRLRDFAERTTRRKTLQTALYAMPFLIIVTLVSFPLTCYETFVRDHMYGLSDQTFSSWLTDQVKQGIPFFFGLTILLIVLFGVFRRAPRTWWLWAVAVIALFSFLVALVFPVYVAPLVNKYQPLRDAAIRGPILQLARANQIPVDNVYEFDASKQTNRVSANVAGFLGTTRIALNDNLLKQCSLPEIRAVMAHEMGHYVLNHGAKLAMYLAIGNFVMFGLVFLLFNWAIRKWGPKWKLRETVADLAAFPLLVLMLAFVSFFFTPLNNSAIRITEREADAFGLNAAREPDGFARVALKLGSYRKLNPGDLEEFIFFDHPSGRARIRMAMDWKAARLPAGETR